MFLTAAVLAVNNIHLCDYMTLWLLSFVESCAEGHVSQCTPGNTSICHNYSIILCSRVCCVSVKLLFYRTFTE